MPSPNATAAPATIKTGLADQPSAETAFQTLQRSNPVRISIEKLKRASQCLRDHIG